MRGLVDFLNHGILPFVGRSHELERVLTFWRGAFDAEGLRLALVVGEAGIGKSRFLEKISGAIAATDGVVLHTKLHPESAASLAPLIVRAALYSEAGRLLDEEQGDTLAGAISALRRLSRLRPLLLIIEDIHLLAGSPLGDLATLLDALSNETISILCAARPLVPAVRGVMERHLIEQIEIGGLTRDDLARVWAELFGADPEPEILSILHETTHGNTLAVRSALRAAVASGVLRQSPHDARWRPTLGGTALAESFRQHVALLSEGMAAQLSAEERRAAADLATLGEVFPFETACALLGDGEALVGALLFKGILIQAPTSVTPLHGVTSGRFPLAFTHTLVHTHFLQEASGDKKGLVKILASGLPLYTVRPFEILAATAESELRPISIESVRDAIAQVLATARALDRSPDWALSLSVWSAADRLLAAMAPDLTASEHRDLTLTILLDGIDLRRREIHTAGYAAQVDRALAMSTNPQTPDDAFHRLRALLFLRIMRLRLDHDPAHDVWRDVLDLTSRFPALRLRFEYARHLENTAQVAHAIDDHALLREAEERFQDLLAIEDLPADLERFARVRITPFLVFLFRDEEELKRRHEQIMELAAREGTFAQSFIGIMTEFLNRVGAYDESLRRADGAIAASRDTGLRRNTFNLRLVILECRLALGAELDEVAAEAERLCANEPADVRPRLLETVIDCFTHPGWLRCDDRWMAQLVERSLPAGRRHILRPSSRVMLALEADRAGEVREQIAGDGIQRHPLENTLVQLHTHASDIDLDPIRAVLAEPILTIEGVIWKRAALDLIEAGSRAGCITVEDTLVRAMSAALLRALEWLGGRRLDALMRAMLARYEKHLTGRQRNEWEGRIEEIARGRRAEQPDDPAPRMHLTMLGTIQLRLPDGEIVRPQGARARRLLGLMVADLMLARPLPFRDFCAIATGEEDLERGRKMLKAALYRLRESISHAAITTRDDRPSLNLDLVDVDLLELRRHLDEATDAARDGALVRARAELRSAMEIMRRDVPFPSLYDDLFEAARADIDHALRQAVLAVARASMREGDMANAREILEHGLEAMPGDEELADLLRDALVRLGRSADAEALRLQMAGSTE